MGKRYEETFPGEDVQMTSQHLQNVHCHESAGKWGSDSQWHVTVHLSEWLNSGTTSNAGEDTEKHLHHVFVNDGDIKGTVIVDNNLSGSYKTKYILTIRSSNCTLWYLPKWNENLCPHENLPMNVYSSFIHNCQNGSHWITFTRWMDKLWYMPIMK